MDKQYTPEQRKMLHKAFKAAKPYLSTVYLPHNYFNKSNAICFCISRAKDAGKITNSETYIAIEHISLCLGLFISVPTQLKKNNFITRDDTYNQECLDNIQQYRHRWLAHLIEQTKPKTAM